MFTTNEGGLDRILRVLVGALLIALPFVWQVSALTWTGLAIGAVLLVTGLVGFCPAYRLLGLRTCAVKRAA